MIAEEFNALFEETIDKSRQVLTSKADEYATDDRLHNFKKAGHLQELPPREALGGMMVKHTVSVYDMINDGENHTVEKWDEKIIDHINYLILLRAIVVEESQNGPSEPSTIINQYFENKNTGPFADYGKTPPHRNYI